MMTRRHAVSERERPFKHVPQTYACLKANTWDRRHLSDDFQLRYGRAAPPSMSLASMRNPCIQASRPRHPLVHHIEFWQEMKRPCQYTNRTCPESDLMREERGRSAAIATQSLTSKVRRGAVKRVKLDPDLPRPD